MAVNDLALSWKDHHGVLISVFEKLLEKKTLVDCTLAAEGKFLKAHKIVLSACSPYLEALLNQENDKHPIIFLRDVQFEDLKTLVEFVYSGEIKIPEDRLVEFLSVAEALQIKGLGGAENEVNSKKPSNEPVKRRENNSPLPRKRARRHSVEKEGSSRDETAELSIIETSSQKRGSENQLRISNVSSIPSSSVKSSTSLSELPADIRKVKEEVQNVLTGVSVTISQEQVPRETTTEEILGLKPEFEQVNFTEDYSEDLLPEDSDSVEPVIDQDQPSSSHQYSGFPTEPIDSGGLAIEQPYMVASSEQPPSEGGCFFVSRGLLLARGEARDPSASAAGVVTGVGGSGSEGRAAREATPKKFQCVLCPKSFTKRYFLRRHFYTHTGEKPYACTLCPARFADVGNLSKHGRVHSGARPYSCEQCGLRFAYSHYLKAHIQTHVQDLALSHDRGPDQRESEAHSFECKAKMESDEAL